jgi:hypothetical protein
MAVRAGPIPDRIVGNFEWPSSAYELVRASGSKEDPVCGLRTRLGTVVEHKNRYLALVDVLGFSNFIRQSKAGSPEAEALSVRQ